MANLIKILPDDIANKIAAGEVVQRPLSVVKELVENAIDADASIIEVELLESGLEEIKVKDNGKGINKEDLPYAVMPHATSKIKEVNDIYQIATLGFRGEALASIASVSKFSIISSTDGLVSYKLYQKDKEFEVVEDSHNKGTTITVSNLFYNTPARLKHLSTTFYELSLIVGLMNKIALANPNIKFKLTNNGNELLNTYGDGNIVNLFQTIYNTDIAKATKEINVENEHFKVNAYIVKPEFTRSRKNNMYISINGRIVKNYLIENMILDGYGKFLHTNQYPIVYIDIEVDHSLVDVNIHPTKEQIKLSLIDKLAEILIPSIKDAILEEEYIARPNLEQMANGLTESENESLNDIFSSSSEKVNTNKNKDENDNASQTAIDFLEQLKSDSNLKNTNKIEEPILQICPPKLENIKEKDENISSHEINSIEDIENMESNNEELKLETCENKEIYNTDKSAKEYKQTDLLEVMDTNKLIPQAHFIGAHKKTYLIFENKDGLYLVDQHAAQERIRYELISNQFKNKEFVMQTFLVPLIFNFTEEEFLIFEEDKDYFKSIGLIFEEFGSNSIRLVEADSWYLSMKHPESDIRYILDLALQNKKITFDKYIDEVAIMMACKSSIKAHDYVTGNEALDLLVQLESCDEPYTCPHGRPIIVNFTEYQLEKMFKRNF